MPRPNLRYSHSILAGLLLLVSATGAAAQEPASGGASRGVEIVQHASYPELRVDGAPFFVHSAAFFYYRIPRDLWETSLDRHRQLGINTLDIYIPWNWHEAREGEFDFDGRTNPRRDLRSLLRIIAEKGFKLIARPGPVILNEWRHGGYPGWLLERPEYHMDAVDRLEGRYPPLSNLNPRDAEAAARGWLGNASHMAYARKWMAAVGRELAPYSSRRTLRVKQPAGRKGEPAENEVSGPLLFVQLDDDMAIGRTNYAGPDFWRYMEDLRSMLEAGGVNVPFYINPTDMRVSAAGAGLEPSIGAMGQWYLQPPPAAEKTAATERQLTAEDVSNLEFFVEELKTQPAFPPILIEYQAGWYCPGDDARPLDSPAENTLVSSRLLLAHGLHGLNYFPVQDTVFPAGYETPWTNRYYRWDAALDVTGRRQPRARAVARNGQAVALWGPFLASSHKRADFGLVYPLGAFPQERLIREDILRVSDTILRLERIALLARLSSELLDPHYQPVEQLLRHKLILLPVFDPAQEKFRLSEKAQRALVEYVRRGGVLAYFPVRPVGAVLDELWQAAPGSSAGETRELRAWAFGQGRVIESGKDFYSWLKLGESLPENLSGFEASWAQQSLRGFLEQAGARPVVKERRAGSAAAWLAVTQLASNAGTGALGARQHGQGLLSVTNLDYDAAAEETLEILSPRAGAAAADKDYISIPASVPPHESLLLPMHAPLCSAATPGEKCEDEIVAAGAELVRAERDGKVLELTFYTPARATLVLRLEREPGRVEWDEIRRGVEWDPEKRELRVELLRGASPDFLRVVKIHLPYAPRVPEQPDPHERGRRDFDYSVTSAVRLPLGDDASLPSDPPLVVLDRERRGQIVLQARNYDELGRGIEFKVSGPVRCSGWVGLQAHETDYARCDVKPANGPAPGGDASEAAADGLLRGELEVRSGRERRSSPVLFAVMGEEGTSAYQFDFDRDAAREWVLENTGLRLIVSPADGGRALALVEKGSGINLTTSVGALRDLFAFSENPPGARPQRARGRHGLFNRPYRAEWVTQGNDTALRLRYDAPDVFPAGASVEKLIRLTGPESMEAEYAVRLDAPTGATAASAEQAFVAVNSVPVVFGDDRGTRFCWQSPAAQAPPAGAGPGPAAHCEPFEPWRTAWTLPETANRLEVRTPGRISLALEWKAGRMTIEMKGYSALLKLQFPPLEPGGAIGKYQVRYALLPAE